MRAWGYTAGSALRSKFRAAGAARAVADHKSLFPSGIVRVSGRFAAQDAVRICDAEGKELARGLANYAAEELGRLLGKSSQEFESVLGYTGVDEVVHRDNICLTAGGLPRNDSADEFAGGGAGGQ